MPVVAVAGGTGKFGRTIVEKLVAEGKHQVLVLAREANIEKEKEIGAQIIVVNYENVTITTTTLDQYKVDIVISTMSTGADGEPELNLIKAAERSTTAKRYIPSIWGIKYTAEVAQIFPTANARIGIIHALEATSLEYTAIINGFFSDYWFAPHVKTHMGTLPMVLDIPNNTAAIPGSGEVPVVFTHTTDIAKYVAALLDSPKWEKESYIIGDKVTWNEFLRMVEAAKGVKFTVTHDSVEKMKTGHITELPSHPHMYPSFPKENLQGLFSAFGLLFELGFLDLQSAHTLNDEFPHIKPRKVGELVEEAWRGQRG